jgi:hypothetical protein
MALGKDIFYRVSGGGTRQSFFKTLKPFFAERLSVGTRQRGFCRVLDPGHSAKCIFKLKKYLPTDRDLALGKEHLLRLPSTRLHLHFYHATAA